jgi:hypothetical protein
MIKYVLLVITCLPAHALADCGSYSCSVTLIFKDGSKEKASWTCCEGITGTAIVEAGPSKEKPGNEANDYYNQPTTLKDGVLLIGLFSKMTFEHRTLTVIDKDGAVWNVSDPKE